MSRRLRLLDAGLLLALVAVVTFVVRSYVSAERTVYCWDHAVFQDIAWTTAAAAGESWRAGLKALGRSFRDDYNALFALPLVPFVRSGESRLSYETAVALLYLCPFALAVGLLCARVLTLRTRLAFWSGVAATLLLPMSWIPALRGYPDAGGAALVVLALALEVRSPDPGRLRDAPAIGALLGLAVVFRRHFLCAALAFLGASLLLALLRAGLPGRREAARPAAAALLRTLLVAVAATATVALATGGFVRILQYDFRAFYAGYQQPAAAVVAWFLPAYGWIGWAAAAVGLVAGPLTGATRREPTTFLGLFALVSIAQWLLAVRQLGEQYTLQLTPVIVVGVLAAGWSAWRSWARPWRTAAATLAACYLAANAFLGLAPLDPGSRSPLRPLLAGKWAPRERDDLGELWRLLSCLRAQPGERRVYVAASSDLLNPDLLRHAEWARFGRAQASLEVLPVPEVDSRDYYPLGRLLDATSVVVSDPPVYHLGRESQRTVEVVHELFATGGGLAADFVRHGESFLLDDGSVARVFRRQRPTDLATALATLRTVLAAVPQRPGMQPDWVVVARAFPWWLTRNPDGSTQWVAHPVRRADGRATTAVYLGSAGEPLLVSGAVRFVDDRCAGATLAFQALDAQGRASLLAAVQRRPGEDGRFDLVVPATPGWLALSLLEYREGASIDYCLLDIGPLRTRPLPR